MPFRLVHLYTGDDGESHFTESEIELSHLDQLNARPLARRAGHRWRLVDDQPWRRVYVAL
jgi:hypothetical protein